MLHYQIWKSGSVSWKRSGSPINLLWEVNRAGGEKTGEDRRGFLSAELKEWWEAASYFFKTDKLEDTKSQTLQTLRGQHANIVVIVQVCTPKTPPIDLVKTRKSRPEARQTPQRARNKNNVTFVGFNRTLRSHLCKLGAGHWCQTLSAGLHKKLTMLTSQLLIKTPQAETSNTKTKSSTKKVYTCESDTLYWCCKY